MTMLSPAATYHAELRQQLESVERALSLQRGLTWLARGLAVGTVITLGLVIWAWTRDGVSGLPIPLLVAIPAAAAIALAVGSLFVRHSAIELARHIDRAANLNERSTTALELGRRGDEFPLAVAQMRDAVEHLRRVDLLEVFPLRAPRNELLAAFFVAGIAAIVGLSPNPWLLRARASDPSVAVAKEEAQRVQRVADSLPQDNSAQTDALRQLLSQGAQTMQTQSNQPDAALQSLQDLQDQVQQMSSGDAQFSAALAAIANALAGNQNTQALSDAINTGDMHQVSQAANNLAQSMANLSPQDQAQLAQALAQAANQASQASQAGSQSQNVAANLSAAANALQASAAAAGAGDQSQAGQQADGSGAQSAQSQAQAASDAMNQLGQNAAAADARQRAASQLESSQNALERALGRTQSRAGTNGTGSSTSPSASNSQGSQGSSADQNGTQSQNGNGQGQAGSQGSGGDPSQAGSQGDQSQGSGSDTGTGGGQSTGSDGQNQSGSGSSSQLDAITSPQMDQSGNAAPDQSSANPYTSASGSGNAQTAPESVQPNYSNQPTQGNDSGSVPLGLRDLVKNYFSSLDQNQK